MTPDLHAAIEAHDRHATLYLRGRISPESTGTVVALCDRIPHDVQGLRIDWRPGEGSDAEALDQLATLVTAWRETGRSLAVTAPLSISVRVPG